MNKILSISVASYNVEDCLGKCIESFINSGVLDEIEIIIVDDGSKDQTVKIAQNFHENYPESIKVISKENGGHGSTINASIVASTGKYFKIVDADDWVEHAGIVKLIEFLKHNEVDLVLNDFYAVDAVTFDKKKCTPLISKAINSSTIYNFEAVCNNISLFMHSITLKTELIKMVGPIIDENCFYVDTEYTVFPIKYISSVVFLDYPVYDYLLGTATQSMNIANMIKRRDQHLRVTKRLINYYNSEKGDLSKNKEDIVRRRVESVIRMQINIYLSMPGTTSYDEVRDFDKWLDDNCSDVYNSSLQTREKGTRYIQFINYEKKHNFRLYKGQLSVLKFFMSIYGKIKNKGE